MAINYSLCEDHYIGITSQQKEFKVSKEDYNLVCKYTWHINKLGYVVTNIKGKKMTMHRLLLNPSSDERCDHVNRDRSDNRRINIRIATSSENNINKMKSGGHHSSKYKGVYWDKQLSKYRVRIGKKHIGLFSDEIEAAKAYNKVAKLTYGSFAYLNEL